MTLRLLLIDDNPDDRALALREVRRVLGEVTADEVGRPGELDVLLAAGRDWDVAVTDYQLHWSTGLDVFRRLRAERPALPVMLFTASGSEAVAAEALREGVDDYLIKGPRHYARVPYAVRAALERRDRRRDAALAAAALQRSEALLKLATQSASMDVWELDLARQRLTVHGGASGLFAGRRRLDVGWLLRQAPADDAARLRSHVQAVASGVARFDEDFRLQGPQGLRWLRVAGIPDGGGRVVGVVEDITARKQAEARLRQADRQKDQFIATLGHELRNPLAPIRYAARLLDDRAAPTVVASARGVIERQVAAMGALLDQLLDLGHIGSGRIELRPAPTDLLALVRHAVDDLQPLARSRGLQLRLGAGSAPVTVHGDPLRLKQVIDNLLHNALKFTPAGGRVDAGAARLREAPGWAGLWVVDDGPGIPPAMLSDVFEPFVQVQAGPTAHTPGGLGIGLAVVRQLVQLHGGTARAFSRGEGQGTRVEVRLPVLGEPDHGGHRPPKRRRCRRRRVRA
ncbi:ATP-binding protein [Aquabacterium sp. J223]|uniref:sensor histidine kinase n=1 Tax=Aquabacterium sp. J223 TaxID=2898431 RepID=UPI0021AD5A6B|nr:ATP-binding protein [Aquabacterium sp. J223]UUX95969.1 ATP-binding protein [Aquabacterium sp. J223]